MLQSNTCRPVAFHELDGRSVARLAESVVVDDCEDDGGNPDQWRPVGIGEGNREGRWEARPDNDEGAVEEAKSVDVDAVSAKAPSSRWHWLASDALEKHAA